MRRVRCLVRVGSPAGGVHEIGEVVEMLDRLAAEHVAAGNVAYVSVLAETAPELPALDAGDVITTPATPKRKRGGP